MFNEILACLDGSSLAEKILPLARAVAGATGGKLTLLRVVGDADELVAEEDYLRDCARHYAGELSFVVSSDAAGAIVADLTSRPNAIAALTTHGRSAWSEAILGSVALRVLREAKRPLLLYCPISKDADARKIIRSLRENHPLRRQSRRVAIGAAGFGASVADAVAAGRAIKPGTSRRQRSFLPARQSCGDQEAIRHNTAMGSAPWQCGGRDL
jgi:nucleotide-binding universal stress UspA family protein